MMCDFMLCLKPKKVNLEECFLFHLVGQIRIKKKTVLA